VSRAGLNVPAAAGVSEETVAFAAGLIDRSGKAPGIEAALVHPTGRRRPLPVRAVLAALVCLALDDRPLFLTDATRLLFQQASDASRALLGVPGTATTRRASWPPTAGCGTASTPSCRSSTPPRCRRTGA
jgi:hypothetical protein